MSTVHGFTIFSSPECDKCDLPVTCSRVKKRYILIAQEPRIRYFLILRDPVVSGIRYFFIPRDPVVPCVWWSSIFLFGGRREGGRGVFSGISLSLRLPLSLRSRDATISLRLYGAENNY